MEMEQTAPTRRSVLIVPDGELPEGDCVPPSRVIQHTVHGRTLWPGVSVLHLVRTSGNKTALHLGVPGGASVYEVRWTLEEVMGMRWSQLCLLHGSRMLREEEGLPNRVTGLHRQHCHWRMVTLRLLIRSDWVRMVRNLNVHCRYMQKRRRFEHNRAAVLQLLRWKLLISHRKAMNREQSARKRRLAVKVFDGRVLHIDAPNGATVYEVKWMLEETMGMPLDEQHLLVGALPLQDHELAQFDVLDLVRRQSCARALEHWQALASILLQLQQHVETDYRLAAGKWRRLANLLFQHQEQLRHVVVHDLCDKIVSMDIPGYTTGWGLKIMLFDITSIPVDEQRLLLGSSVLEDRQAMIAGNVTLVRHQRPGVAAWAVFGTSVLQLLETRRSKNIRRIAVEWRWGRIARCELGRLRRADVARVMEARRFLNDAIAGGAAHVHFPAGIAIQSMKDTLDELLDEATLWKQSVIVSEGLTMTLQILSTHG